MPNYLPNEENKLLSIGEVAKILSVSIDTIRRWDKAGVLHSTRPDGKTRFFDRNEIDQKINEHPMSIGDAASFLKISQSTLRRIEKRGLITPQRNSRGERVYTQTILEDYKNLKKENQAKDSTSTFTPPAESITNVNPNPSKPEYPSNSIVSNLKPVPQKEASIRVLEQTISDAIETSQGDVESETTVIPPEEYPFPEQTIAQTSYTEPNLIPQVTNTTDFDLEEPILDPATTNITPEEAYPVISNQFFKSTSRIAVALIILLLLFGIAIIIKSLNSNNIDTQNRVAQDGDNTIHISFGDRLSNTLGGFFGSKETVYTSSPLLEKLVAGDGIEITGDEILTIANIDTGSDQLIWKDIAVAGQTRLTPSSNTSTLNIEAGSGVKIVTDTDSNTLTFSTTNTLTTPTTTDSAWNMTNNIVSLSNTSNLVGIGTNSPGFKLDVSGDIRIAGGYDLNIGSIGLNDNSSTSSGASLIGVYDDSLNRISGNTNVQEALKQLDSAISSIQSSPESGWRESSEIISLKDIGDNVGIGTTSPTQKVHIAGSFRLTEFLYDSNNSAGLPGQILSATSEGTDWIDSAAGGGLTGSGFTNYITKWTTGGSNIGDSILYDNGGNVGVSTTTPLARFDIAGTLRIGSVTSQTDNNSVLTVDSGIVKYTDTTNWDKSSSDDYASWTLKDSAGDTGLSVTTGSSVVITGGTGISASRSSGTITISNSSPWTDTSGSYIQNQTTTNQSASYRISGSALVGTNIGIGTTSPQYTLDVNGNARISTLAGGSTDTVVVHSSGVLQSRSVDTRVWGTSLVDGSSLTQNYLGKVSDTNTLTNSLVYDNGSNVGIGNTAPLAKLDIAGTLRVGTLTSNSSSDTILVNNSNIVEQRTIDTRVWGSTLLDGSSLTQNYIPLVSDNNTVSNSSIFESSTNVGIGTTTPTQKLHISGNLRLAGQVFDENNSVGTPGQVLSTTATGVDWIDASGTLGGSGTDNFITKWTTAGSVLGNSLLFDNGNNVGIGTTTPLAKLDVEGTLRIGSVASVSDNSSVLTIDSGIVKYISTSDWDKSTSDDYASWTLKYSSGDAGSSISSGGTAVFEAGVGISTTRSGSTIIITNSSPWTDSSNSYIQNQVTTDQSASLRVSGSGLFAGNIGIGTTSPQYSLDVNGNARISTLASGSTNSVVIHSSGVLQTRDVDSRVWGTALIDGSSLTDNYLTKVSDSNSIVNSNIFENGSGNVGIGTSIPSQKLTVSGSIATSGLTLNATSVEGNISNANFIIGYNDLGLRGNGAGSGPILLNDTGGNVGIGTSSSPSRTLHVNGTMRLTSQFFDENNEAGTPGQVLSTTATGTDWIDFSLASAGGWTDDGSLVRLTGLTDSVGIGTTLVNANTKLGVLGGVAIGSQSYSDAQAPTNGLIIEGNMGIGTTLPLARMDVVGQVRIDGDINMIPGSYSSVQATNGYGLNIIRPYNPETGNLELKVGYSGADLTFQTSTSTNGYQNYLVFTGSGNLGIGTTSPLAKLDINGNLRVGTVTSLADNNYVLTVDSGIVKYIDSTNWDKSTADDYSGWTLKYSSGDSGSSVSSGGSAVFEAGTGIGTTRSGSTITISNTSPWTDSSNSYIQNQTATDQSASLRISGTGLFGGNVGIGTTNPGKKLSVVGGIIASGGTITSTNNGDASGPVIGFGPSQNTGLFSTTDVLGFTVNGSEKIRIDNGNLGVGTTAPTQRLHISGNLRLTGQLFDENNSVGTPGQVLSTTATGTDWIDFSLASAGGWTDDGSLVRLTGLTDSVGIGTTLVNANTKLGVLGGVAIGSQSYSDAQAPTNGLIIEGNMGIGTTSPDAKLNIFSNLDMTNLHLVNTATGFNQNAILNIEGNDLDEGAFSSRIFGDTSYSRFSFRVGGRLEWGPGNQARDVNLYRVDTNLLGTDDSFYVAGNIGVGITSPATRLHVGSTSTATNRGIILTQANDANNSAKMVFQKSRGDLTIPTTVEDGDYLGNFGFQPYVATSGFIQTAAFGTRINGTVTGTSAPTDLYFHTGSTHNTDPIGSGAVRMYINSLGNIGIGLTNPSQKLHISGNMRLTGQLFDENNTVGTPGQVLSTTATGTDWIDMAGGISGSGTDNYISRWNGTSALENSILFDSGDNIGIGTTTPIARIDIDGTLRIGTVSSVTDNSSVLTVDGGIVKYIDSTNWDKSTSDDYTGWTLKYSSGDAGYSMVSGSTGIFEAGVGISTTRSNGTITITNSSPWTDSSSSYIQNQIASDQSASLRISGTGLFGSNIGIGTTSPAGPSGAWNPKMEINGDIVLSSDANRRIGFMPAILEGSDLIIKGQDACFLAGTKITMANGSYKEIEDVEVGETVKTYDTEKKEFSDGVITHTFHHDPEVMADYYLIINTNEGSEIKVTTNHPIFANGKWQSAGTLNNGDKLINESGEEDSIISITRIYNKVPTYNLEVESLHVYFADGLLVHNKPVGTSGGNLYLEAGSGTDDGDVLMYGGGLSGNTILAHNGTLPVGFVGIGTSLPTQELHISGDFRLTGQLFDENNSVGTPGQVLSTTATGTDWIDMSGGISGSGTTNYITKWSTGGSVLGDSLLFDNATSIGIGTSIPHASTKLGLAGNMAVGANYATVQAPSNGIIVEETVGIGVTLPGSGLQTNDYKLHIQGSGSSSTTRTTLAIENTSATGASRMMLANSDGNYATLQVSGPSYSATPNTAVLSTKGIDIKFGTNGDIASGGTKNIYFSTGGYDVSNTFVAYTSDKLIGLGTTSPVNKVDIEGGAAIGATYSGTSVAPDNGLIIEGNTGIGTTSPIAKLSVRAAGTIGDLSSPDYSQAYLHLSNTGQTLALDPNQIAAANDLSIGTSHATGYIHFTPNNTTGTLFLKENGNIGMGTTLPSSKLHISDGNLVSSNLISTDKLLLTGQSSSQGISNVVSSSTADHRAVYKGVRSRGTLASPTVPSLNDDVLTFLGAIYDGTDAEGTAGVFFKVDGSVSSNVAPQRISFVTSETDAASRVERLTIRANGNIGVGITSPTQKLDVYGSMRLDGQLYDENNSVGTPGQVLSTTATGVDWIDMGGGLTGSGTDNYIPRWNGTTALENSVIYDTGANIGIGTSLPGSKLEIAANSPYLALKDNTSAGSFLKFITDAGSSSTSIISHNYHSTGMIEFLMGDPNPATATMALAISQQGNVGIGITSPTQKLDVYGSMRLDGQLFDENNSVGTPGQVLSTTATGTDWIDMSGGISGSGTTNYITKWSTGGSVLGDSLLFDNATSIGIGTSLPHASTKLGLAGNMAIGATYGLLQAPTNGLIVEGNIGIGVTLPGSGQLTRDHKLHVRGSESGINGITTVTIENTSSDSASRLLLANSSGNYGAMQTSGSSYSLGEFSSYFSKGLDIHLMTNGDISSGGTNDLYIKTGGYADSNKFVVFTDTKRVGIGTTIPISKLHISGGNATVEYLNNSSVDLLFKTDDEVPAGGAFDASKITGGFSGDNLWVNGYFSVSTHHTETATLSESLRVMGGNMGIGTTSPTQRLHVSGNLRLSNHLYDENNSVGTPGQVLSTTATGVDWIDAAGGLSGSGTDNYIPRWNGTTALENSIIFDSGNNIGIGTTTPSAPLEIQGVNDLGLRVSATSASIELVPYVSGYQNNSLISTGGSGLSILDSSMNYTFVGTSGLPASVYVQDGTGSNKILFYGNGNSYINGGNLGIGTTSPTRLLDVLGTMRLDGQLFDENNSVGTPGQVLSTTATGTDWIDMGGGISGSGTTNYLTKWSTGGSVLGDSLIFDNGTNIGIGTTTPSQYFQIGASTATHLSVSNAAALDVTTNATTGNPWNFDLTTGLTQTGHFTAMKIDLTNLTYTSPYDIYGLVINDNTGLAGAGTQYGLYVEGTNWDWSARFDDGVDIRGNTQLLASLNALFSASDKFSINSAASSLNNAGVIDIDIADRTVTAAESMHAINIDLTASDDAYIESPVGLYINIDNNAVIADDSVHGIHVNNEDGVAAADALIHLSNSDTDTAVPDGILVDSLAGGITDALDLSDAEIVNAINLGQNTILASGSFGIDLVNGTDDLLSIVNSGAGNASVYIDGNIGIGTTSPTRRLDVLGDMRLDGQLYDENNSVGTPGQVLSTTATGTDWIDMAGGISGSGTTNYLTKWSTGGSVLGDSLLFDNATSIGIGTSIPHASTKFALSGNFAIGSSYALLQAPTNGLIVEGNVGIGTSNPRSYMHVGPGVDAPVGSAYNALHITNNGSTAITMRDSTNDIELEFVAYHDIGNQSGGWIGTKTSHPLFFETNDSMALMTLDTVGNLGIGVTAPTQRLHVDGTMRLTGQLYDYNNSVGTPGQVLSTTGTGVDWIDMTGGTPPDFDAVYAQSITNANLTMEIDDAGGLIFNMTAGDFELQTGAATIVNFDQTSGLTTFYDDITASFAGAENMEITYSSAPTVDMLAISNAGQGIVTTAVNGLNVTFVTSAVAGSVTNSAIQIATTSGATEAGDVLYGVNIEGITGQTGTEYAVRIGSGWDAAMDAGALPILNIGAAGTDFSATGGLTLADGLSVSTGGVGVTAGGITITAGALAVNSDSITSDGVLTIDATSAVVLGTGTNGFRVDETWSDSTSGFTGTARPIRKVTLIPEYAGAVITPDGTSNTGTMTSDFCSSTQNVNEAATPTDTAPCDSDLTEEHNYYTWTSSQASQDYDIWVRWQVPTDFSSFSGLTDTVQAYGWRTGTSEAIEISMFDTTGTADATSVNVATTNTQWTINDVDDAPGGTYATGGYVTFKIHMVNSTANNDAKVGEIVIKYNAKL